MTYKKTNMMATTQQQEKVAKSSNMMNTLNIIVNLVLFVFAVIAYFASRRLTTSIEESWGTPSAKDEALKNAMTTRNLTFLIIIVPIIMALFGFIWALSQKSKNNDDVAVQKGTTKTTKSYPAGADYTRGSKSNWVCDTGY